MGLLGVGLELGVMRGSRPLLAQLRVHAGEALLHTASLAPAHLPVAAPLLPEQRALLALDRRRRGEHRPQRLTLGRFHRFPFTFHAARLPAAVPLHPATPLVLEAWLHLYDPLPFPPIFYLLGSAPRVHPLTHRTHHLAHRRWTLPALWGPATSTLELSPCGCGARARLCLGPGCAVPAEEG